MNYRHAYHAGNFADVMKHAVLCRVLTHLRDKPAAFRVIDTHAGAGVYDLGGVEAGKTLEWRDGIGRLIEARLDQPVRALLAPYLDAVAAFNPAGPLTAYPGSPALVQSLLRPQDRLIACELEPQAAAALSGRLRGDARAKAIAIDGWTALTAYVPPKERRGLVLVDPPFEQPGELSRLAQGLSAAHRKWPTGCYMLWYPIKDAAEVAAFVRKLVTARHRENVARGTDSRNFNQGHGIARQRAVVVNPPWRLYEELAVLLPALGRVLSRGATCRTTVDWLTGELSL